MALGCRKKEQGKDAYHIPDKRLCQTGIASMGIEKRVKIECMKLSQEKAECETARYRAHFSHQLHSINDISSLIQR